MAENDDDVLDRFEDEPERHWLQHWSIVFGPVVLFIVGVLFRIQHWPGASFLIAAALTLILLRSFIFFFSKRRAIDEWFYFLGRIGLISVLVVDFAFIEVGRKWMLAALSLFAVGIIFYLFRRKEKQDPGEGPDDDY